MFHFILFIIFFIEFWILNFSFPIPRDQDEPILFDKLNTAENNIILQSKHRARRSNGISSSFSTFWKKLTKIFTNIKKTLTNFWNTIQNGILSFKELSSTEQMTVIICAVLVLLGVLVVSRRIYVICCIRKKKYDLWFLIFPIWHLCEFHSIFH